GEPASVRERGDAGAETPHAARGPAPRGRPCRRGREGRGLPPAAQLRDVPLQRSDERRFAPTQRNRAPILTVLERVLPARGLVLEIASGTGEHAVAFARALPSLGFQPSDADPDALAS